MEPSQKRVKKDVLIRICDSFVRSNNGNIICPIIKAEESLRVFFKFQTEQMTNIVTEGGNEVRWEFYDIHFYPVESNRINERSIFIQYVTSEPLSDEVPDQYKNYIMSAIRRVSNVRNVLIHKVNNMSTIPQPIISEMDMEICGLNLTREELLETNDSSLAQQAEIMKLQIEAIKENRTKIAILSHNGKGKSFILNLLFLLTADTEEEYLENNRNMIVVENIEGDPTIEEMMTEENLQNLPNVIKDFIKKFNERDYFKPLVQPICRPLMFPNEEDIRRNENSFCDFRSYFLEQRRIRFEGYLLAQKHLAGSYVSTTKCIIHLRYGTVYQMKVEYFTIKELQEQLYELKALTNNELAEADAIHNERKEASLNSLRARFTALTNYISPQADDQTLQNVLRTVNSPENIILCEDVHRFAGETELYIGRGRNITEDRLALQVILKNLTTEQDYDENQINQHRIKVAMLKNIVVYIPSKILDNGKEILEMPGTDNSDSLAVDFIQKALDKVNVVLLLSDFSFNTIENEVRNILRDSDFIKNWQSNDEKYKLMLLTYPEKNCEWQFGRHDLEGLQKLEIEGERKRRVEINEMSRILTGNGASLEDRIYTSYILPVLHTSIHAQEGEAYEILDTYDNFLKHTGVKDLMLTLDTFVTEQQRDVITEVKRLEEIARRQQEIRQIISDNQRNRPNNVREAPLWDQIDKHLSALKQFLETEINEISENEVRPLLLATSQRATERWNEIERVTSMGIFCPYFSGRNPNYQVKIYNILFDGLDEEASPIFIHLLGIMDSVIENYKTEVSALLTEKLKSWANDNPNLEEFVKDKLKQSMGYALSRYMCSKTDCFNEKTLKKYFKKSLKNSLTALLDSAYRRSSIEDAKREVTEGIQKINSIVSSSFKDFLNSLHEKRWPPNFSRFVVRAFLPLSNLAPGCTFCGKWKCSTCSHIKITSEFQSSVTEGTYIIHTVLNCTSSSVIYLITCKKCRKQYVGQTRQSMHRRFGDHLSRIRSNTSNSTIANHFKLPDHSLQDAELTIIEEVKDERRISEREKHWINVFTQSNCGLNRKDF